MSRTKKLALCAVLAALGVGVLMISTIYSPISPALAAAAGLFGAVAVIHCGIGWSLGVFAVSGGLGFLLCPVKSVVIFYLLFFGWYPVAKSLLERIASPVWRWLAKLAVAAVGIGGAYYLYCTLLATDTVFPWYLYAVAYLLCLGAFVAYDLAFSALISFYLRRIAPHIK